MTSLKNLKRRKTTSQKTRNLTTLLVLTIALFLGIASLLFFLGNGRTAQRAKALVVILTDFGVKDRAVSAMKGVMYSVDESIAIVDLTHEVEPFNIHEASYRLYQSMQYYPKGTVFVCVVDPELAQAVNQLLRKQKMAIT